MAIADIKEAMKLMPGDKDAERYLKLNEEDMAMDVKVKHIMSNAELLKGKEYLDFILDFVQGRKDEVAHKEKKYCYHEISEEEVAKLKDILAQDKDLIFYFNAKDGLKTLIGSLDFN